MESTATWLVDYTDRERVASWTGSHAGSSLSAPHGRCQSRQRHSRNLGGAPVHLGVWRVGVGDDTDSSLAMCRENNTTQRRSGASCARDDWTTPGRYLPGCRSHCAVSIPQKDRCQRTSYSGSHRGRNTRSHGCGTGRPCKDRRVRNDHAQHASTRQPHHRTPRAAHGVT